MVINMYLEEALNIINKKYPKNNFDTVVKYDSRFVFYNSEEMKNRLVAPMCIIKETKVVEPFYAFDIPLEEYKNGKTTKL